MNGSFLDLLRHLICGTRSLFCFVFVIGASQSEPTLIVQWYLCVYLCIIYPAFCHTLVPEIHMRPEMLCVFWYIELMWFT